MKKRYIKEVIIRGKGRYSKKDPGPKTNTDIRYDEIRVIGNDGKQYGVISPAVALEIAKRENLDLVEIAANAKPPVCKIVDFGKYMYEQTKKIKNQKKKQSIQHVKEIKMKPHIDKHDLQIKLNHAIQFLEAGHKVKVRMMFFGRMLAHIDIGEEKIKAFVEQLEEYGKVESIPKRMGNNIIAMVTPSTKKKK